MTAPKKDQRRAQREKWRAASKALLEACGEIDALATPEDMANIIERELISRGFDVVAVTDVKDGA